MNKPSEPKTLVEAIKYYSDTQTCINAVAALRWPDGKPVCPKCHKAESERKRTLQGTYVAVEPFHMDRYLDEQTFRFNNRLGHNDGTRFRKALSQVGGKRLTWVELTGKGSLPAA